jgi:sporulation protein YlmC with PRC-barrel domain
MNIDTSIGLKRKLIAATMASAFGIATAMPAVAQNNPATGTPDTSGASGQSNQASSQTSNQSQQSGRDMRADALIGMDVRNAQGEDLGEIQELFVNVGSQRVHYAVLSFGGFLGLGDKLFAYPMSAFSAADNGNHLLLNVDQQKLKNAPGFERDTWPDYGDNRYFDEVDRFFSDNERKTAAPTHAMMRATELIGRDVNDRSGDEVGEIEDMVVGLGKGRISYVVLEFDEEWSPDDKLLPLPLTALTFPKDRGEELVLNVPRDQLDMATGFNDDDWPDVNASTFRQRMNAYFTELDGTVNAQDGNAGQATSSGSSR